MVGGTAEHFERWNELLMCFCEQPLLIGPIGQAAALKLALNQFIASHITAFSVSLGMIQRSGVDVDVFMKVLRQSALMTTMFDKKLPRLLKHDYSNPNFPTAHLLKDITLCLKAAQEKNLEISSLLGIKSVLEKAVSQDFGNVDYSSIYESIVPSEE